MKIYKGFKDYKAEGLHRNEFYHGTRTPTHTHKDVHKIADDWFFERFGVRARSATLMCSTSIEQAASYARENGTLAEIIPVEPFSLIFSIDVDDFYRYGTDGVEITREGIISWLEMNCYQQVFSQLLLPDFNGEVMVASEFYYVKHIAR